MWCLHSSFVVFPVTLEAEEVMLDQQEKQEKHTQINHQSLNPKYLSCMSFNKTLEKLDG